MLPKRHRSLSLIQEGEEAGRSNQRCWLISSFEAKKINGANNRSSSYFSSRRTVINLDGTLGKLWSTDLRVSGLKPLPGGGTFSPKVNFDNVLPILEKSQSRQSLFWFPGIASKLWCCFPTVDFVNNQCTQ